MNAQKDPFEWVGQTIDEQFTVEEVVGEGGFAVVYRGHHKGFDEKVAIKALKFPAKLGEAERAKFLESFQAEGKLLRKLSSADAGIVQALDVGAATSPNGTWTPYLVLEWLEGETLEADLKARRANVAGRSLGEAIALLEPAARGLATAHALGVAHRDIKPANLFLKGGVGEKRSLKILDFGIAKVMTDSEDVMRSYEATGDSIHAFSPKYGSPEQFDRRYGATGPWTDVFALALVLVEVVAGKSAMTGDTSQLFLQASNGVSRPTLRSVGIAESDAVERVLTRALAVETRDRFPDADAFWSALREAAAHGDTVLSERGEDENLALTRVEGEAEEPSVPPGPPPPLKVRVPQMAVAALLFFVGVGAAWSVLPHHGFFAANEEVEVKPIRQSELAIVPSAASAAVTPPAETIVSVSGYTRYTNDKFHFVVDIPNELVNHQDTVTGDGRVYTNVEGDVRLEVFGGELVGTLNDAYRDAYEMRGQQQLERWILPQHTLTNDMYVIAGYEKDDPFLEKMIVTGGTYAKLKVVYPFGAPRKGHYEEMLPHTRDSLSFTAVSDTVAKPLPADAGH